MKAAYLCMCSPMKLARSYRVRRLTAWELTRRGIPVTLICDSMAAQVMREKKVQLVVVGADRIASNGDAANKIGTYGVAVLAQAHGIPFYVAAPSSTFDLSIPDGSTIQIEQRDPREITHGFGRQTAHRRSRSLQSRLRRHASRADHGESSPRRGSSIP